MKSQHTYKDKEQGNVLFLILIAVALFAALSYAVTQSTRSGSGTADKEKSLLSSASMTQYPTALRTSIIRMVLGGTDVSNIYFNTPANFSALSDVESGVFHPSGGGGVHQKAPSELMAGTGQGTWSFNANWEIVDIGINGAGGNDVIAFLPDISQNVCRQINEQFSINVTGCTSTDGAVPDLNSATTQANIDDNFVDGDTFPTGDQEDLANATCTVFSGQPSGCFNDTQTNSPSARYVFYSVLLER